MWKSGLSFGVVCDTVSLWPLAVLELSSVEFQAALFLQQCSRPLPPGCRDDRHALDSEQDSQILELSATDCSMWAQMGPFSIHCRIWFHSLLGLSWLTPPLPSDLSPIVLWSQGARMGQQRRSHPALPPSPCPPPPFLVLTSSWNVSLLC